jgi:hypothetical protein
MKDTAPSLFFKINVAKLVHPEQDVSMVYHIRHVIADVMGAKMDRVLVEVRESGVVAPTYPTNRRLLAAETIQSVIYVWIYPNTAPDLWPPTGTVVATEFENPWKPTIITRLTAILGFVSILTDQEMDPVVTMPYRPQLYELSVAFAVDFELVRSGNLADDIEKMTLAIKTVMGSALTVDVAEIRILSVQELPTSTKPRFSVEIRMPTAAAMESAAETVKSQSDKLAMQIVSNLKANALVVEKVYVRGDNVKIVENTKSRPLATSWTGLIVGIVVGSVALIALVAVFVMRHRKAAESGGEEASGNPVVTGMDEGLARMYNYPPREQMYVCPQTMTGMHPNQDYRALYYAK